MVRLKKVTVLLLLLTFSVIGKGAINNNLIITKDIEFQIEIGTVIGLDPVDINFGDIVRGSNNTITKTEYLKFKTAFTQESKVTVEFTDKDLSPEDKNYGKFELEYQNKDKETYDDKLPVYIKRIKDMEVKTGEKQIPITAEIRGVPEDQRLGKYYKSIKINVITSLKDPITSARISGEGGMK